MRKCNACKIEKEESMFYPNITRTCCIECFRTRALNRVNKCADLHKSKKFERIKCNICDLKVTEDNTHHFEWNHRNPTNKKYNVSQIKHKLLEFDEEIKKCDLLCLFCHADITKQQRKDGIINTKPRKY